MTDPAIGLPDAEQVVIGYLAGAQAAPVALRNPAHDGPFVRVRRVGGLVTSRAVDVATLDVLVWHPDDDQRMGIAQECRSLLFAAAGHRTSTAVLGGCREVMGPRRMPDPADVADEVVMFTVTIAVKALQTATPEPVQPTPDQE